jgi:hypothetical protein
MNRERVSIREKDTTWDVIKTSLPNTLNTVRKIIQKVVPAGLTLAVFGAVGSAQAADIVPATYGDGNNAVSQPVFSQKRPVTNGTQIIIDRIPDEERFILPPEYGLVSDSYNLDLSRSFALNKETIYQDMIVLVDTLPYSLKAEVIMNVLDGMKNTAFYDAFIAQYGNRYLPQIELDIFRSIPKNELDTLYHAARTTIVTEREVHPRTIARYLNTTNGGQTAGVVEQSNIEAFLALWDVLVTHPETLSLLYIAQNTRIIESAQNKDILKVNYDGTLDTLRPWERVNSRLHPNSYVPDYFINAVATMGEVPAEDVAAVFRNSSGKFRIATTEYSRQIRDRNDCSLTTARTLDMNVALRFGQPLRQDNFEYVSQLSHWIEAHQRSIVMKVPGVPVAYTSRDISDPIWRATNDSLRSTLRGYDHFIIVFNSSNVMRKDSHMMYGMNLPDGRIVLYEIGADGFYIYIGDYAYQMLKQNFALYPANSRAVLFTEVG